MRRSLIMRLRNPATIVTAAVASVLLPPTTATAAAPCPIQDHLFVNRPNVASGRGQATTVWIVDFTPDPNCQVFPVLGSNTERHSTAHVRRLIWAFDGWAEIGYWRGLDGAGTEHTWIFWEVQDFNTGQRFFELIGAAAVNLWARFLVEIEPGSSKWEFKWDRGLTGTYDPIGPDDGVAAGFIAGVPMGETTRQGAVDATDTHKNLYYQTSTFSWVPWTNQAKEVDQINGYHWHKVAGAEYRVHTPDLQH